MYDEAEDDNLNSYCKFSNLNFIIPYLSCHLQKATESDSETPMVRRK
jgi:hypothetical protein